MKIFTFLIAIVGLIMCGSCASIVGNSQYPVLINSNPEGANITIRDSKGIEIHRAKTPITITLPSSDGYFSPASYLIKYQKEGYYPTSSNLFAEVSPWYFSGNLFSGFIIGWLIVDPLTGAMWKLEDTTVGNLMPDPAYKDTILDQLKDIKSLLDSGILSNDEYEVKRKALIDKLPN